MARRLIMAPGFIRNHVARGARAVTANTFFWAIGRPTKFAIRIVNPSAVITVVSGNSAIIQVTSVRAGVWECQALAAGNTTLTITTTIAGAGYSQVVDIATYVPV